MRIQHNIMAMSAYRNYTNNVSAMKKNLEKLSSGYKINRAGDDAAGLAISEKMRAQITGLETAQKNAKDGISLVQTAEGALTEVHDMLNRMVELATQSANGTYDNDTDRYQLQKEMDQLRAEIDRIADSSNFNGIMLLDGSMDAGGDIKYTSGAFQFAAQHPAGIGSNYELPAVGSVLGTNTVLHTNGTKGGDTNAFSIDLENIEVLAGKSVEISFGGATISVTAAADKNAAAKDIVQAIVDYVKDPTATSSTGITIAVDGATATTDENGNNVLEIGGAQFALKASGSRLTFTQTGGTDIEMPNEVTIGDKALVIDGSGASIADSGQATDAKASIDLSGVTYTEGSGTVVVSAFGGQIEVEVEEGVTNIGEYLAQKVADYMNSHASEFSDSVGGVLVSAEVDSTDKDHVNLVFTAAGTIADTTISVSPKYEYEASGDESADQTAKATPTGLGTIGNWNNATAGSGTGIITGSSGSMKFTLGEAGDIEIKFGATASDDTIAIAAGTTKASDLKTAIENMVAAQIKALNEQNEANAAGEAYDKITSWEVQFNDGGTFSLTYKTTPMEAKETASKNFSGDYNKSTTVLEKKTNGVQDRLASTYFDLSKLTTDGKTIAEGTTITIGRDTYTFTYDTNKIGKDGYVVLDGGENPSSLQEAAFRLSKAAENNGTYTVGWDDTYSEDGMEGRITITEKDGQTNFDLTTMEGIEKSLGYKIASTNPTDSSKGLTLQIGDTAESYNQLKVNIKDCHTKALGLDLISIANQADAADAVSSIKAAINYVSDVRGTLGATQNRLDHTINNLSVMTENIQDAESTVRDVDIAEEMMAYTKNNILIQSAQAMLAQANQVPQGVLQLLQ